MGTLNTRYRVTIADEHTAPITLTAGEHFRLFPSRTVVDSIEQLTARQVDLVRLAAAIHVVSVYSGGLDSAAGLTARLVEAQGQEFLPVTVRYQSQRGRLIREHFDLLRSRGIVEPRQIRPMQVGAYILNNRLQRDFGIRLREVTHRCRPFLFLSVAGLVASLEAVDVVEVYESGIGAVNLPLVSVGSGWRTTLPAGVGRYGT